MCANWLQQELEIALPAVRSFVALGKFAFEALIKNLKQKGHVIPKAAFGHGVEIKYEHENVKYLIICSYHPSQQNTFTGKLTKEMLDSVLKKAGRFTQLK